MVYRCHRKKVPVVTVGHDFAIGSDDLASSEECWGKVLTKPFRVLHSPDNPTDSNAILVTSASLRKLLGFLSKELGAILSHLAAQGACAIFGVAGHITVEVAERATYRERELYV